MYEAPSPFPRCLASQTHRLASGMQASSSIAQGVEGTLAPNARPAVRVAVAMVTAMNLFLLICAPSAVAAPCEWPECPGSVTNRRRLERDRGGHPPSSGGRREGAVVG